MFRVDDWYFNTCLNIKGKFDLATTTIPLMYSRYMSIKTKIPWQLLQLIT